MNANKETHSRVLAVETPWQGVCTSAFSASSAMNCLCRIGVCLRSFFLKKTNKLVNVIILQPLKEKATAADGKFGRDFEALVYLVGFLDEYRKKEQGITQWKLNKNCK